MTELAPPHTAAIWVADGAPWEHIDYGTRLTEELAAMGWEVLHRDFTSEQDLISPLPVPVDFHILSGGGTSVNDLSSFWMLPALARVAQLVEEAAAGKTNLLGVCLGSQMIAHSLAPGCVRSSGGFEAGLREITYSLDGGIEVVPEFHYEEIAPDAILAAGGSILAHNAHSAVQVYSYGPHVRAAQFHPEWTVGDMLKVLGFNGKLIQELGGDVEYAREETLRLGDSLSPDLLHRLLSFQALEN